MSAWNARATSTSFRALRKGGKEATLYAAKSQRSSCDRSVLVIQDRRGVVGRAARGAINHKGLEVPEISISIAP